MLNPYLRAFFRSALPAQCEPKSHILLVPKTEALLYAKDRDTNTPYVDLAGTEEFLASHVLRVPGNGALSVGNGAGRDIGNMRENKSKAKQYSTFNGRTVVVKESYVYSNKGFRTLCQTQILGDAIYYPDAPDGQQWLLYYISRPLLGIYTETPIIPAVISSEPSEERRNLLAEVSSTTTPASGRANSKKKDIKNFGDLLAQFPMISRQMQSGLEKIIREFISTNGRPTPTRQTRSSSISSGRSTPSIASSIASVKSSLSGGSTVHPTALELDPAEEALRTALENALSSAIELFQKVDKQQLSLLGSNTELTGPLVEGMIERYVLEQVHDQTLFPAVCALRKSDDADLEAKIRKMADIDIGQVGIPMEDGQSGKRQLTARLMKGVDKFKKMGVAGSPQEMLQILLDTQIIITATDPVDDGVSASYQESPTPLTINADILVSMLLIVVIRSGVRHLHSRLLCMRYFIFTDDVESGEQGYALATLEAVLAHLTSASATLRKTSKRNRLFWQAVKTGDIHTLELVLRTQFEVDAAQISSGSPPPVELETSDDEETLVDVHSHNCTDQSTTSQEVPNDRFAAVNSTLGHVYPFQRPPTPPPEQSEGKAKKRVSLASLPRSYSASSAISFDAHSRSQSIDSDVSASRGGDVSPDTLAQTQDVDGNSALMMAVDAGRHDSLKFLLSMPAHFRISFVLSDVNHHGTTLLSAAMQSGHRDVTDEIADFLDSNASPDELRQYLEMQDDKGRCFAHYLFHQPHLTHRYGKTLPWRLKDKNGQTPLFALCRSYDHEQYHAMVDAALSFATITQGDGEPLHLDDHVDAKGNTLLHIINDTALALRLLRKCDSDVNAANDKRFTPLMVGSKYGRIDLVRTLFGDPRVDMTLRDLRGLSAVELAKDDDVRNRIDDLILLSTPAGTDGRITTVVRSFFVEDATVRLVMKSGAPNNNGSITVTTCRRSVLDFENLARWLSMECPASWLPAPFNLPSPFLIPSKPSRAVLRDIQIRMDNFFHTLLTHGTFATHELVWEFFLVPELDVDMLTERSKRKAEIRVENAKDDFEPLLDSREVESFVAFARDQMRGIMQASKKVIRATNKQRMQYADLTESYNLASTAVSSLLFLPPAHVTAVARHVRAFTVPTEASPLTGLYYALHSVCSTSAAIQLATDRPAYLIGGMAQAQRAIDRSKSFMSRSSRWTPNIGGFFEDAKRAVALEAWDREAKARAELESLGCELRYTHQTIATELAVWQDEHVRSGRATLRRLAKESIVRERVKLEGMQRALREIRKQPQTSSGDGDTGITPAS